MNAIEYNRAIIGHVWSLRDLPFDWAGYGILSRADMDGDMALDANEKNLPDWAAFTAAVKSFQQSNFLRPDGMLGPNTFEKLVQAYDLEIEKVIHWAGPIPICRSTRPTAPPEGPHASGRTPLEKRICSLWNLYGGAICKQADAFDLPVAAALAVFSVESGKAYDSATGRIIIRFEDETVWKSVYHHADILNDHRNQADEWAALGRAASENIDHAVMSASWGLGQVMGFNHAKIGYGHPLDMVRMFQEDVGWQVHGFFMFCKGIEIDDDIRAKNWDVVVRRYNGARPDHKKEWVRRIYHNYVSGLAAAYDAIEAMRRRGIRFLED